MLSFLDAGGTCKNKDGFRYPFGLTIPPYSSVSTIGIGAEFRRSRTTTIRTIHEERGELSRTYIISRSVHVHIWRLRVATRVETQRQPGAGRERALKCTRLGVDVISWQHAIKAWNGKLKKITCQPWTVCESLSLFFFSAHPSADVLVDVSHRLLLQNNVLRADSRFSFSETFCITLLMRNQ